MALCLTAALTAFAAPVPAHAQTQAVESFVFLGGGAGHSIGMSQFGMLGRAQAAHTYTEILGFYYDDTTIGDLAQFDDGTTDFSDHADVDVLVEVAASLTLGPPAGQPDDWELEVTAGGTAVGTVSAEVQADWDEDETRWVVTTDVDGTPTDLCDTLEACDDSALEFALGDAEVAELSGIGSYRSGQIVLHPAALEGPKGSTTELCGSPQERDENDDLVAEGEFCVIHGGLTMSEYLYGIAEVPRSWPAEALKAQVVAARSFAARKILSRTASASWHAPFEIYDTTHDQIYSGVRECGGWCAAVDDTAGEVVVYETGSQTTDVAETFYSTSNGGYTASPVDVWASGSARSYLQRKPDPYDSNEQNPHRLDSTIIPADRLTQWLADSGSFEVGTVTSVSIDAPLSRRVDLASVTVTGADGEATVAWHVFAEAVNDGCGQGSDCRLDAPTYRVVKMTDIVSGRYYYDPVVWLLGQELTTGTSPTEFSPDDTVTRGQIATFLWRFAGEPEPDSDVPFSDVPDGRYYTEAVKWMFAEGITTGTSPTTFSPGAAVSRGQIATFLWRFGGEPEATASVPFSDVPDGRYYSDAVQWLAETGITTGTSPTTFSPDDTLTRGQIATFLWRLAAKPTAVHPYSGLAPYMGDYRRPSIVPQAPEAPMLTVDQASPTQLAVAWAEPANGNSPITGYELRYRKHDPAADTDVVGGGQGAAVTWSTVTASVDSPAASISGLDTASLYVVQVRAANAVGDSEWSPPRRRFLRTPYASLQQDETGLAIGGQSYGALKTSTGLTLPILDTNANGWVVWTPCANAAQVSRGEVIEHADFVIDAGHGGNEIGAGGPGGTAEKTLNLQVAMRIRDELEAAGYTVALTREADVRVPIITRGEIARALDPTAILSVHFNGSTASQFRTSPRTEIFYQRKSDDSKQLADLIYEEVSRVLAHYQIRWQGLNSFGVMKRHSVDWPGYDWYGMLRRPGPVTSVLIEYGYLNASPDEEALYKRADVQQALAEATVRAIERFEPSAESGVAGWGYGPSEEFPTGPGSTANCTDPALE